jgi:CheY-like chemotaxis protein
VNEPEHIGHEGETMPRILLVEDNPVNQMVAQSMVSKMGYEVVIANNGQEAVDAIKSEDIDLVLMDCHMPVMDGFEATEQIRNHLNGKTLPIIAMTADASISDRDRCINAGMDDHLPKPIKIDVLRAAIENWLKH